MGLAFNSLHFNSLPATLLRSGSSSRRTSNWEDSALIGCVVYPNPGYRQGPAQAKVERIMSKRKLLCPMMNCAGKPSPVSSDLRELSAIALGAHQPSLVLNDDKELLAAARMDGACQAPLVLGGHR